MKKIYAGEKFYGSLDYHNIGKIFMVLLLTGTKTTICVYLYIGTQNGTYKIGRKTFVIFRKCSVFM